MVLFIYLFFKFLLSLISFFNFGCEQVTHFALAFELPGGWHKEKDAMTLTVLQVLSLYTIPITQFSGYNDVHLHVSLDFILCILELLT